MQVLIDIPTQIKTEVDEAWNPVMLDNAVILNVNAIANAIRNGVMLPEVHGKLIDAEYMKTIDSIQRGDFNSIEAIRQWVDIQPTIIDASDTTSQKGV